MKKAIFAIALVSLLFAAFVSIWSQTPSLENPQLVEETLNLAKERFEENQDKARNPDLNAYLSTDFVSFWGAPGMRRDGTPAGLAIEAWSKYSVLDSARPMAHQTLLKDKDYLEARHRFETLYPKLEEATKKPVFFVPTNSQAEAENFDILNLQRTFFALLAYAESLAAEERVSESVGVYLRAWAMGSQFYGNSLYDEVFGHKLQSKTTQSFVHTWHPGALTQQECLTLVQELPKRTPQQDQFLRLLQIEMGLIDENFRLEARSSSVRIGPVSLGFLLRREQRMFYNDLCTLLGAASKSGTPSVAGLSTQFSVTSWLMGRSGYLAAQVFPTYQKPIARLHVNRAELHGIVVACGLLAHKAEHGTFPKNLTELEALGIKPREEFPWESFEYSPEKAQLRLKLSSALLATANQTSVTLYEGEAFMMRQPDGLVFRLK